MPVNVIRAAHLLNGVLLNGVQCINFVCIQPWNPCQNTHRYFCQSILLSWYQGWVWHCSRSTIVWLLFNVAVLLLSTTVSIPLCLSRSPPSLFQSLQTSPYAILPTQSRSSSFLFTSTFWSTHFLVHHSSPFVVHTLPQLFLNIFVNSNSSVCLTLEIPLT